MAKTAARKSRPRTKPKPRPAARPAAPRAAPPKKASSKVSASKAAAASKRKSGSKWVYAFGGGKAEGRAAMRNLLGGKGAGLAEMANLGLPVPPGFTITTEVCTYYYANAHSYPKEL